MGGDNENGENGVEFQMGFGIRDQSSTRPSAPTATLTPPSSDSPPSPPIIATGDPLRDSKGRRISREHIESRWAKTGAVNRADIRPEDDPGTLAGESSTSDEEELENGKDEKGRKKKKTFLNLKAGLNIFGRKKKTKTKQEKGAASLQHRHSPAAKYVPELPASTSDDALQAPLAQPEETETPERRADASSAPSNGVIQAAISDSQLIVTDFGDHLIINGSSPLAPGTPTTLPQSSSTLPMDINRPDESIELMDSNGNNNVPYDQLTEDQRREKIAKVVEKLESIASQISNSATPVADGSFPDADAASTSSAFSSSAYNPLSMLTNIRDMLNPFSSGAGSAGSASSTTASNLVHLADWPLDRPLTSSPRVPDQDEASTNIDPELIFTIDKEERRLSPESGVDVVSPADGAVSPVNGAIPQIDGAVSPTDSASFPIDGALSNTDAEFGNGAAVASDGHPATSSSEEASTSNATASAVPSTSSGFVSNGSRTRRSSVPMTLNLDLNLPADRERLYQPILRELLGPACGFTDFSRIASTILRPHNRAGQLAKFFEITSNALLMTGSQRDQERLKEWAMKYFEENLAAYIVEEGWDGVLEGDEGREAELIMDLNGGGGGGETETSRDSELD